jgi:hypothetical protein
MRPASTIPGGARRCKENDRAKSQCFICDPSLQEKYAALYRAKYGKEPPPPEDNMPKKEDKK